MEHLFSGKRNAVKSGWEDGSGGSGDWSIGIKQMGQPDNRIQGVKGSPNWDRNRPGRGLSSYLAMPPTLVASCPLSSHGQTAAEGSTSAGEGPSQVSLSSEEEPVTSTSSQPPPKRPRRSNSVLAFLQKQLEKEE
ncbi:hypothetical protein F7725_029182, partial [Dissostichus mawsoni]